MLPGVWLGVAKSSSNSMPALAKWRDEVVAPTVAKFSELERFGRYTAFNLPQTLLLADVRSRPHGVNLRAPDGVDFASLSAAACSEVRQPGLDDPTSAPLLYTVIFKVADDWQAEFDEWYDVEHIPMIFECKDWSLTRRYRLDRESGYTHLAIHYIMNARAFDSPALKAARLTPWRAKFLEQSWFTGSEKAIYFQQSAE
jgi:hypothetical protein